MIGLGRILAEARAARGLTLEEVERETRIARRYLLALEEEQFRAFPTPMQARGFLRSYARFLELEPAELLALFPDAVAADDADGLLHGDRIFRSARAQVRRPAPPLELPRPPVVVLAVFAAVLLLGSGIAWLGASGNERLHLREAALDRVAADTARVPDVRELPLAEALLRLEEVGITPMIIEGPAEPRLAGRVITQSPPPEAVVLDPRGDVVLVVGAAR